MPNFSLLKSLFDGSLFSNNRTHKAENNSAPVVQGDGNTVQYITLAISPDEERKIKLSEAEKQTLFVLAEGARIAAVRGGDGGLACVHIYGSPSCADIDNAALLQQIPALFRKSLIDLNADEQYVISPIGRRIVLWLDNHDGYQ